jgi:hypothetical protein
MKFCPIAGQQIKRCVDCGICEQKETKESIENMTDYESWYQQQVDSGNLPDKDGYYHFAKTWEDKLCEAFIGAWSNTTEGSIAKDETD